MPHNVMEQMQVLTASPFHSVTRVEVYVSPDPNDREIYKIGSVRVDGNWVDTYALAKIALDRLMVAAGIEETNSTSRLTQDNVWYSRWEGRYTQPDGKTVPLSGEKEIDLRVGGTRWQERKVSELDSLLKEEGVALGRFAKTGKGYVVDGSWVKQEHLIQLQASLSAERLEMLDRMAGMRATRFVVQQAQFGLERAQTGARLRAVRTIMQLGQYTLKDLKTPFVVIRSRYDIDKMQEQLGPELLKEMLLAQAAKMLGLSDAVVSGLLSAPQKPKQPDGESAREAAGEMAYDELEASEDISDTSPGRDGQVEQEIPDRSTADPFDAPVEDSLLAVLARLAAETEFASLGGAVGYVLHKQDISHGDGLVMHWFFENVLTAVAAGRPISEAKAEAAATARQAVAERRLPQEQE